MRRLAIFSLTAAALLAAPTVALACFCGGLANPCRYLWGYDGQTPVVFEGTVESIEQRAVEDVIDLDGTSGSIDYFMNEVRFRDVRHLLGESTTVVLTGTDGGNCGHERFRVGRRFVVHALPDRHGLTTGTCSFTAPVEEASEVLDYIASLSRPSPGARIDGKTVLARREHVGLPSSTSTPLAGVRVTLDGPEQRSAVSGVDGSYTFDGLTPGVYQVSVASGRRDVFREMWQQDVRLANAHACATPHTTFYVDGVIEGTVNDADGRPVTGAAVSLRAADIAGQEQVAYDSARSDGAGHFRFRILGEGAYVVGLNLESGATDDSAYALTIATDGSGAPTIVELAEGGHVNLAPIVARLPALTTVTGRLMLPDGRPVPGANVRASAAGENHRRFGKSVEVTTDAEGRFLFSLGQQQPYRFSISVDAGTAELDTTVTLNIALTLRPRR